jgi:ABC-type multidrug transport system fused ATPase/permease subunit
MHQVIVGELSIGSYTAFAQYVQLYQDGFQNLADIWINFRQTITSTGKFVQLLLRETQIPLEGGRTLETCTGAITLENVFFEYKARPDQLVLKGVSLNVVPGTSVALVGESGAGKSTVGRLLQRYYDPTEGSIKIDGVDFKELNLRWLRSQIGNVEQEPVLFDRPIYENIAYGSARGAALEDIQEAARTANAHDFIKELQKGYKTDPGERAARISGGQKQRVAIARAIIRNPKVLLLDEATSALDSENEHIVQQALDNLMVGKTTFIIAHRLSTIVHATKIVVLDKGVILEQGSHDELVADDNSKYSSFMKHQLVKPLLE